MLAEVLPGNLPQCNTARGAYRGEPLRLILLLSSSLEFRRVGRNAFPEFHYATRILECRGCVAEGDHNCAGGDYRSDQPDPTAHAFRHKLLHRKDEQGEQKLRREREE